MGEVYRALDTRLDRTVAIKILPANLSDNPEAKQQFEREARTISSLNHPNICTLHDVGSQDGTSYLVMEHVQGETLGSRLRKGPLPLKQALECGLQICDALEKAHHAIGDGWDTYSSRRWKTNIQTLQGALATVEQLRGVSYDLKDSGKHEVGVIAEEVGAVVPEIVSWEKNGKDASGVDYSRLTALLIEATKEQQALIEKQQQRINKQQAQMASQRAQISRLLGRDAQQAHALPTVAAQMTLLQSKLERLEGNVNELK